VPKVAREEQMVSMSSNRRNAKMRENIGQYVDACAELGVPQRDLFITADLFENKNWKVVLKNCHGLARHCHYDIEGFPGPHIGIRKKSGRQGPSLLQTMSSSADSVLGTISSRFHSASTESLSPKPRAISRIDPSPSTKPRAASRSDEFQHSDQMVTTSL